MPERYRTIVVDPPWEYADGFRGYNGHRGGYREMVHRPLPYVSLPLTAIIALPVIELADSAGANLFVWTTNRYLPNAFDVLTAWGATYRQIAVWFKTGASPLTGSIAPTACEFLLFARFGAGAPLGERWSSPLITTKRPGPNQHSRKPDVWLDRIEQISPGPRVELFSRRERFGWDYRWHDLDPAPVAA